MSNKVESTVFVVDDMPDLLSAMEKFFTSAGLPVETFESAREFLDSYKTGRPGCLLLDLRMPDMSGLELQEDLRRLGAVLPVIMISAYAQVSDAVKAMKMGSFDFIERPFSSEYLLGRVREALEFDRKNRINRERFEKLTMREKQILSLVVSGTSSKAIASALKLSVSTVDNHRSNIMKKLDVGSAAELVKFAVRLSHE